MPAEHWNLEVGSWHETYLAVLQAETNDDRSTRNSNYVVTLEKLESV